MSVAPERKDVTAEQGIESIARIIFGNTDFSWEKSLELAAESFEAIGEIIDYAIEHD